MAQDKNSSFMKKWKEFRFRRKQVEPIPFTETSILTDATTFKVSISGFYLPLPPMTAAVLIDSFGQKMVFTEGGYKDLQTGVYSLQYVDLSERFITLPSIVTSTSNGPEISLTISITYKIKDPLQIIHVSSPLRTLFELCDGAIKNYITNHRFEELISENENGNHIFDYQIVEHIKEVIALSQACRAFWLMDVVIVERHGSSEIYKK